MLLKIKKVSVIFPVYNVFVFFLFDIVLSSNNKKEEKQQGKKQIALKTNKNNLAKIQYTLKL